MTAPVTKIFLSSSNLGTAGYRLLASAPSDFSSMVTGVSLAPWISGISDLNGDGIGEVITGSAYDDDKDIDAGRVFVTFDATPVTLGDSLAEIVIDGVNAGDHAGSSVGSVVDLNADGKAEILVGASGMDDGAAIDAGAAFVIWGKSTAGGIDLGDPFAGDGNGYVMKGEAAGDAAGSAMTSISDLNANGKAEIIVGATGNDAGGADAGAAYVVFGKSSGSIVNLSSVAAGSGGYKIIGENAGDHIGAALATLADVNGDGKEEILLGAADSEAGGAGSGAAYVVFGKSSTASVDLSNVAAGVGGYRITGDVGDRAGDAVSGLGDINGDGVADMLVGAGNNGKAYVVFGKSTTSEVLLSDVAAGVGGFVITAEAGGDLRGISVAKSGDFNRDGIADIVIGTPHDSEGGVDAGAVYVVWGGISGAVDLTNVANGMGGAKIVGVSGSLTGISVAALGDMNGDAAPDLLIGSAGAGYESVSVVYASESWLPDLTIYGSSGSDMLYGTSGNDTVDAMEGNDTIIAGAGNDTLDGGAGADSMVGGTEDDMYIVDSVSDVVVELAGEGTDKVIASVDTVLAAQVEVLELVGAARVATGNALSNTITGTSGNNIIDGGAGVDTLIGGAGDDLYHVDSALDVVVEHAGEGKDTVIASVDYVLGDYSESLQLVGAARVGTGNASDNLLTGGAGNDTLNGAGGNDTLDGGAGVNVLVGGVGDDVYLIHNATDVIVEDIGGGNDTVWVDADWTIGNNIEAIHLTGASHAVTGNAVNNHIAGGAGDDTIDGGDGDDLESGGDGDDDLISASGLDTLVGGSGDDRYVLTGGSAHIEDFLGHDCVDTSDATGNSYVDLSGDTHSTVEGADCDLGNGGSTVLPLDVQFLQDLSGSFGDDIATVRGLVPGIVSALQAVQANSMFGSSTFVDKPIGAFGSAGDWVYSTLLGLTSNTAALTSAYNNMVIHSGNDEPEAQIEALMQLALHTTEVGFRPDSARFVVLFTDAPFHQAGDGASAGITTANDGDAVMEGTPAGTAEDYPMISQLKDALIAANIIPIFAVTSNYATVYQGLTDTLGRGTVVALSPNSANVVAAISAGLTAATVTTIEDAVGGVGNDTICGNEAANDLSGNAGNDSLRGAVGDDSFHGGLGNDTMDGGVGTDVFFYGNASKPEGYDSVIGGDGYDKIVAQSANTYIGLNSLAGIEEISSGGFANVRIKTDGAAHTMDFSAVNLSGIAMLEFGNGIDQVTGSVSADYIKAYGGNDVVACGDGNDRVYGGLGNDFIRGDAGKDTLYGDDGADTLVGGLGNDTLSGGLGDDVFLFGNASLVEGYDIVIGDAGIDAIQATQNGTYIGLESLTSIESISAGAYTGVAIKGSAYAQNWDLTSVTLTGITVIDLGNGNDTVIGSAGADTIRGQVGDDVLSGGAGVDALYGGIGADLLAGGLGADKFIMTLLSDSTIASHDTIIDFSHAQKDRIYVNSLDANASVAGDQAFSFIGAAAFGAVAGQLRAESDGVNTHVTGDVNGDGFADFQLDVTGTFVLGASDFSL